VRTEQRVTTTTTTTLTKLTKTATRRKKTATTTTASRLPPTRLDPRPCFTTALERVLAAVVAGVPSHRAIDARSVVVVGGAAHGTGSASVRELRGVAGAVVVDGNRRSIELCLRPPFLLDGDAPSRLTTLVHEVLHLDPARPGRLLEENRHRVRPHASLEREARALARTLLDELDPPLLLCLAHDGEVLLRQWRHRPIETTSRRRFGDDDVFDGPVFVRTPADRRGGWW
jgi:hypothetical protein